MVRIICLLLIFGMFLAFPYESSASIKDCVQKVQPTPLPFDKTVKEDIVPGVIYLAFMGGDTPKPNDCGLNPSNPNAEWKGWGNIDSDNVTIENCDIVIGAVYFERGLGTHAAGKIVYDLTGGDYAKFEAYGGIADDPGSEGDAGCATRGSTIFVFTIDKDKVFETPLLKGLDAGKNVPPFKIEFNIPKSSKQLVIDVQDGGDGNGCDHSSLGDARLLTPKALEVEASGKLAITWASIKVSY